MLYHANRQPGKNRSTSFKFSGVPPLILWSRSHPKILITCDPHQVISFDKCEILSRHPSTRGTTATNSPERISFHLRRHTIIFCLNRYQKTEWYVALINKLSLHLKHVMSFKFQSCHFIQSQWCDTFCHIKFQPSHSVPVMSPQTLCGRHVIF